MQTHTQRSPYSGRPIIDWYEEPYKLRDKDGDTVGDIVEVNPDFHVVESDGGFLGLGERRPYFIPRGKIAHADGTDLVRRGRQGRHRRDGLDRSARDLGLRDRGLAAALRVHGRVQTGTTDQGRMRMVRFEVDLEAQKIARQTGEVSVRKDVVEETRTIDVPVRREEVHVERRAVTDAATTASAFTETDETIRVPVMEEDMGVRKVARPVEEVTKDATEETRQVSDTVRKERFDIEGDEGSRDWVERSRDRDVV